MLFKCFMKRKWNIDAFSINERIVFIVTATAFTCSACLVIFELQLA